MRWFAIFVPLALALSLSALDAQDAPKAMQWKLDKRLYTPADASRYAAQDTAALAQVLAAEQLQYIRYLSLANIPSDQRAVYAETLGFLLNSLSRENVIVIPAQVGPDGILVRVNLYDYAIPTKAWDALDKIDPYFHEKVVQTDLKVTQVTNSVPGVMLWKGGVWPGDGKPWPAGSFHYKETPWKGGVFPGGTKYEAPGSFNVAEKVEVATTTQTTSTPGKSVTKTEIASSLDPEASKLLVKVLQSRTPILRGDWFIVNASLPPVYHDLLRLKTLDDAKELALFDKRAERLATIRATVVDSGSLATPVAENNRILFRIPTAYGAWWQTQDFLTNVGEQNVVNNFLTLKADGGEIIFTLPNGLQAYFLINAQNERVDEVPIAIAKDTLAKDKRVRNGRSCIWCHTLGIQPFESDFKLQVTPENLTDLGLNVKNDPAATFELARQIRRVFELPDFAGVVRADNMRYAAAVKAATSLGKIGAGRATAPNAAIFLQLYDDYARVPLGPDRLIYEAGISDIDVQAAIKVKLADPQNRVLSNNGVLLRRLAVPPLAIRREHWEEGYADFMLRVLTWQAAQKK